MVKWVFATVKYARHASTFLIHSAKTCFQNVFVLLIPHISKDVTSSLISWHKRFDFDAANFDIIAMKMSVTNVMNQNCPFMLL